MEKLVCKAYAKLNLTLDITGTRADGYHNMDMLMSTISLCDTVTVSKQPTKITITCSDDTLPTDEKNIAHKAAAAFFAYTKLRGGCHIDIVKQIPAQAGLGGGSSDGAAVLVALNRLYNTALTQTKLGEIGAQVGADLPFLSVGGAARVRGIGDLITALSDLPQCAFVVCMPKQGISTKEAFAAFDCLKNPQRPNTDRAQQGIDTNDYLKLAQNLGNAMELAMGAKQVESLKFKLMASGADGAAMTGSGAAVFGIFTTLAKAQEAQKSLSEQGILSFACTPTEVGVQFVE